MYVLLLLLCTVVPAFVAVCVSVCLCVESSRSTDGTWHAIN